MTEPDTSSSDIDLTELADRLYDGVEITDRKHRLKTYERCFVGSDAVDWMIESGTASDESQAVALGNLLLDAGHFHHVLREQEFENDHLFYRFSRDEDHGEKTRPGAGRPVSWGELFGARARDSTRRLQPNIRVDRQLGVGTAAGPMGVAPMDPYNVELLDQVHPAAWDNPTPDDRYNMVVIGAGTGGLVTAASVAGLGGRVALVEEHLMGGDCLNFGCVPSKALLRSARAVADVRRAGEFGVRVDGEVSVDFPAVMRRLRRLRSTISHHDSAERFARELGVDVFIGRGKFVGDDAVQVGDQTLKFAKACIATGARPAVPPIEGLDDVPYLTNVTVFNLTELPPRLAIVGAGAIGCEMAQAFARFGSDVTLFEMHPRVLPREEEDAAAVVEQALFDDGVRLRLGSVVDRVERVGGDGAFEQLRLTHDDGDVIEVDALLVATGRAPNVEDLGLDAAGIEFDPRLGVTVDDRLQTTNPDVFAVGDVATEYKFTHAADFMARTVVRNALFFGREKFSSLLIPWATYTEPELAHVGLYPEDLEERGIDFRTHTRSFAEVDRAILEGETEGFARFHVRSGSDEIMGATVVGAHAGELISEIAVAMQAGVGLGELGNVIHPYPTRSEALRQAGDAYNRTRLTPTVSAILRNVLAVRR